MNDLEITRACAEAMGYGLCYPTDDGRAYIQIGDRVPFTFAPLHDDAQAMALVKRFRLNIGQLTSGCKVFTSLLKFTNGGFYEADAPDLNRAICLCVAQLASKPRRAK